MTLDNPVPEWLQDSESDFLTAAEYLQVEILFSRIWPADAVRKIPGARDVNAARYVTRLLARSSAVYRDIPKWQGWYRDGLAALDRFCLEKWTRTLVDLPADRLDELLTGLERQTLAELTLPAGLTSAALFDLLRRHCIQGCLADPRWGGNSGGQMWRSLGFYQPAEAS